MISRARLQASLQAAELISYPGVFTSLDVPDDISKVLSSVQIEKHLTGRPDVIGSDDWPSLYNELVLHSAIVSIPDGCHRC